MKTILRAITVITAALCVTPGASADEQVAGNNCPKPYLDIDVADSGQLQILEREFILYEACFIDYALALSEKVNARKAALDKEVPEDSWSAEREDEQIRAMDEAIKDLEAYGEALAQSRRDFKQVVRAILTKVPANVFNQWDAETKIAEP